eukprot:PhF_6_TR21893/c0_g1_i1/m.31089/K00794/ribH, RIB4; 6,7-dimethyl-8-ribityllumazine synthase
MGKGVPVRDFSDKVTISQLRVSIVHTQWNEEIVQPLLTNCTTELKRIGIQHIAIAVVGGCFELCNAAGVVLESPETKPDVVICLGAILKGETSHYEFLSQAVITTLAQLSATNARKVPVVSGILTCETMGQMQARLGSGTEWAQTGVQMALLRRKLLSKL